MVGGSVGPLHVSPAAWAACTVGRRKMKFSSPHTGSKYFHWKKKKKDRPSACRRLDFFLWSRKYPENLQSTHLTKHFCSHPPHKRSPLPCMCWEREDRTQFCFALLLTHHCCSLLSLNLGWKYNCPPHGLSVCRRAAPTAASV